MTQGDDAWALNDHTYSPCYSFFRNPPILVLDNSFDDGLVWIFQLPGVFGPNYGRTIRRTVVPLVRFMAS